MLAEVSTHLTGCGGAGICSHIIGLGTSRVGINLLNIWMVL